MTPLEYALHYAARGWRVAPCAPGTKHPRINAWQTHATTNPTQITTWWTDRPDDGICIATGPDSGIWALDIDPDHGGDDSLNALTRQHGDLPDTIQSITGRGGTHYLFTWPTDGRDIHNNQSGRLGAGIDIRGAGGQIVAPPTIHPNGHPYTWELEHDPLDGITPQPAPTWLLDLLHQPASTPPAPRRPRHTRPPDSDLPGDWWAARTSWPDELGRRGWTLHSTHQQATGHYYELWTRPGKTVDDGASASLYYGGSNTLKVFSTNAHPLQADATYQLWGFHVTYQYGGDYSAAAADVRHHMNTTTPTARDTDINDVDDSPPQARSAIIHNGRQLADVTHDAITALHHNNQPPHLFQRAGQLVRLRHDEHHRPLIETLRTDHARTALSHAATWWRITKDGDRTGTSPPVEIANAILAATTWPMPPLTGVVEAPVLRPDGTFHTEHGHDPTTGLYHWHTGHPYPHIPDTPTRQQLTNATNLIDELLCDFPWDTTADRANTWALLLTPLTRPIIGQVPMALIDAPEPGTGKGLLVKACSIVTTGHAAALMAWPATDEELEKKITATLMAGHTVVVFDNVEGMIRSPTLAAVLTADTWQGRVLGRSEMTTVPQRATWAATGNNIDVGGDLARRCYRIRLDARQAQPWLRTGFRHPDLETWATHNRHQLLHALCTIIRSWVAAGRPLATTLPAMGGYSSWVQTIGGILHHAGINDFLANLADFHATADREAASWEAFLAAWNDEYGEQAITVGELVARIRDTIYGANLRGALPDDLVDDIDRPQFTKRLGHALRKRCGRHYGADGRHLVEMPRDRRRVAIYAVTTRSIRLFEPDLADQQTRDVDEVPRDSSALTRDDADERGIAGSIPATPHEKSYPQDQKTGAATALQDPAIPRPNHETPGHTTEPPRGISTTSRDTPVPATTDIEDPFT